MYARATWFEGPADQVEARVAEYPQRMQSIKEASGCIGIAALVNRETGAGISVTYWDTQESMLATEAAGEKIRAQVLAEGGPQVRDVDRFEVILQERVAPPISGTFVRVNDFVTPPANVDAVADVLRGRLPAGRDLPGFRAVLVSANRDTGRMLVASIWDTAADREASLEAARSIGDELRAVRGDGSVKTDLYEVVYSDITLPATV
jgi:heme-degrading monooxygenase HmoA